MDRHPSSAGLGTYAVHFEGGLKPVPSRVIPKILPLRVMPQRRPLRVISQPTPFRVVGVGENSGQGVRRGENLHVATCLTVGWSCRVEAGLLTRRGGGNRCGCDRHRNGPGCQQKYVAAHPQSHDRSLRIPTNEVTPKCWSAGWRWCCSGAGVPVRSRLDGPIPCLTDAVTWAQALLAYPRGFHSDAGDSGWVAPVSSQARAVTRRGPGWASTVSDHIRHAHWLGAGCRRACRQV